MNSTCRKLKNCGATCRVTQPKVTRPPSCSSSSTSSTKPRGVVLAALIMALQVSARLAPNTFTATLQGQYFDAGGDSTRSS
eukprot:5290162-Pyramimonas_sp.AAC.1